MGCKGGPPRIIIFPEFNPSVTFLGLCQSGFWVITPNRLVRELAGALCGMLGLQRRLGQVVPLKWCDMNARLEGFTEDLSTAVR